MYTYTVYEIIEIDYLLSYECPYERQYVSYWYMEIMCWYNGFV